MTRRQKNSGGQALVMMSLSLMAMAGLMGLAVDMGWSFFVQQQAQGAADGAAMAAVQEAYKYFENNGGFSNVGATCGTVSACSTTALSTCPSAAGNLLAACLYASRSGFTGAAGSNQKVTIQAVAATGTGNITIPGTTGTYNAQNVDYWVRVVAVQTVPQILSGIEGHSLAVVSSSSVAAITGNSNPANLVLLDQPNDCFAGTGGYGFGDYDGGGGTICGENIDLTTCSNCSISASGSIFMASTCNGSGGGHGHGNAGYGCGDSYGATGSNYAGDLGGGGGGDGGGFYHQGGGNNSVTSSVSIQVQNPGAVNGSTWTPTVQTLNAASAFLDPTTGLAQPPIAPGVGAVKLCGVQDGIIDAGHGSLTVGPYGYYATDKNGNPTGDPVTVNGNITFSSSGGCPGTTSSDGVTQGSSAFPTYLFYGGMVVNSGMYHYGDDDGNGGFGGSQVTFGSGQYVMVGVSSNGGFHGFGFGSNPCNNAVFCVNDTNLTVGTNADTTTGTMFIFTAPQALVGGLLYPGLSTQITGRTGSTMTQIVQAAPNWGNVNFQSASFDIHNSNHPLTGVIAGATGVPTQLSQYNGVLFWQDRANSTVQYDTTGHVLYDSNGHALQNSSTYLPQGSNAMGLLGFFAWWGWGSSQTTLNGVVYQPRGAYFTDYGTNWFWWWGGGHGNGVTVTAELITGAVYLSGSHTSLTLGTPTHRLVSYKMSMLQ